MKLDGGGTGIWDVGMVFSHDERIAGFLLFFRFLFFFSSDETRLDRFILGVVASSAGDLVVIVSY